MLDLYERNFTILICAFILCVLYIIKSYFITVPILDGNWNKFQNYIIKDTDVNS